MAKTREEMLNEAAKATVTSVGNYLRDGRGRLAVKKFEYASGFKGDRFAIKFVVVSSQKIPVYSEKQQKALDIEPNAPGTEVDIVWMTKHPSTYGNVKGLIFALYGESADTTSDEEYRECLKDTIGSGQPTKGMQIDYSTVRKLTDENKVEIVLPSWSSVEQSEEVIKQTQKWMDSLVQNKPATAAPAVQAGAKA